MKRSNIAISASTSRSSIFNRLVAAGGGEMQANGWAVVDVEGWEQPEWISPALVLDFISQGLAEHVGNRLEVTEAGKTRYYDESKATLRFAKIVHEVGDTGDANGTERPKRAKRTSVGAGGGSGSKVTDSTRVKLLGYGNVRGGELLFMKTWEGLPDATGSIAALAEAFTAAGTTQKDPLVSARYYVKRQLAANQAQIIA